MNELEKLIADFKVTLSKFEAIASRMEARIAQLDPVDPLADLPPLPPVPEGYSRWEYRGKGWKSDRRIRFASLGCLDTDWVTFPFGCTVGYADSYYIEAVKDESIVPDNLLPLPPVPEGYSRWVYRGKGWKSKDHLKYAYQWVNLKKWFILEWGKAHGFEDTHYLEAVKDPS